MKSLKISFPTVFALLICSCLSLCSYAEVSQTYESNENTEVVYTENGNSEADEPGFFRKVWDGILTVLGVVILLPLCLLAWKVWKWIYTNILGGSDKL